MIINSHTRRLTTIATATPLLVLVLAACGGSSSSAPPGGSTATAAPSPSPSSPPGVFGTAAAVTGSSLEVQSPTSGQVTVDFTTSTHITQQQDGALSAVVAGSCVTVTGTPGANGTTLTARMITVSQPVNGTCGTARGFGLGGGGQFGGGPSGARATPRSSQRPRPSTSDRTGGAVSGTVTSLSGTTIMVNGTLRGAGSGANSGASPTTETLTVTTDQTTRYSVLATVPSSALKVGECVAALGQSNDIGVVTATSISIVTAGPNGCVGGQGARNGSGAPSGGGNG
jgi:Domain of unknown function (DUF5666)